MIPADSADNDVRWSGQRRAEIEEMFLNGNHDLIDQKGSWRYSVMDMEVDIESQQIASQVSSSCLRLCELRPHSGRTEQTGRLTETPSLSQSE
jgi:hypothetical protein